MLLLHRASFICEVCFTFSFKTTPSDTHFSDCGITFAYTDTTKHQRISNGTTSNKTQNH